MNNIIDIFDIPENLLKTRCGHDVLKVFKAEDPCQRQVYVKDSKGIITSHLVSKNGNYFDYGEGHQFDIIRKI